MMILVNRMRVSVGLFPSSLKVFTAYEAAVYIDVGERYRTDFLKIKVEDGPVDLESSECSPHILGRVTALAVSRYRSEALISSVCLTGSSLSSSSSSSSASILCFFNGRSDSDGSSLEWVKSVLWAESAMKWTLEL